MNPTKLLDQTDNLGAPRNKYIKADKECIPEEIELNKEHKRSKIRHKYCKTVNVLHKENEKYVQPDEWSRTTLNVIRKALANANCELSI